MNVIGNYMGQAYGSKLVQGIGALNEIVGLSWIAIAGNAGEIYTPGYTDIYGKTVANTPMVVQAVGGNVKLSFTLENPGFAASDDPLVRDAVSWVNEVTIEPGSIQTLPVTTFTVVKVEFIGTGVLYMAGR